MNETTQNTNVTKKCDICDTNAFGCINSKIVQRDPAHQTPYDLERVSMTADDKAVVANHIYNIANWPGKDKTGIFTLINSLDSVEHSRCAGYSNLDLQMHNCERVYNLYKCKDPQFPGKTLWRLFSAPVRNHFIIYIYRSETLEEMIKHVLFMDSRYNIDLAAAVKDLKDDLSKPSTTSAKRKLAQATLNDLKDELSKQNQL